jgi:methyltransferase (TIGR00027 family)
MTESWRGVPASAAMDAPPPRETSSPLGAEETRTEKPESAESAEERRGVAWKSWGINLPPILLLVAECVMAERASSTTALGVAALRAAHQLLDGEPKILNDPVVLRILDAQALMEIRSRPAALRAPWVLGLRSHVVLRSRYAEDRLAEAVHRGMRQYVSLGAGFDTFAYRQPEWAQTLRIFEVDHPASQQAKRARLEAAGIAMPSNVEFVSIDFEHVSLGDGLAVSSLDHSQPAFFSCLGVLVYLTEAAADAVFQVVASFPASSEMVFTFSAPESALGPGEVERRAAMAAMVENMGEPWRTHFDPEVLRARLRELGFSEFSILTPAEAREKYFRGRSDGLHPPRRGQIARAVAG